MRRLLMLLLTVGLLFAAGCDGGDSEDDADATTTEAPDDAGDDDTGDDAGDDDTGDDTGDEQSLQVEFPGGGPVDEVFPPGDRAYELLSQGNCGGLLAAADSWPGDPQVAETEGADTITLYQAAAHACYGHLDEATGYLAQLGSPPQFSRNPCARGVVLEWVRSLVDAYEADPAYAPEFVPSDDPNPCPDEETTGGDDGG